MSTSISISIDSFVKEIQTKFPIPASPRNLEYTRIGDFNINALIGLKEVTQYQCTTLIFNPNRKNEIALCQNFNKLDAFQLKERIMKSGIWYSKTDQETSDIYFQIWADIQHLDAEQSIPEEIIKKYPIIPDGFVWSTKIYFSKEIKENLIIMVSENGPKDYSKNNFRSLYGTYIYPYENKLVGIVDFNLVDDYMRYPPEYMRFGIRTNRENDNVFTDVFVL